MKKYNVLIMLVDGKSITLTEIEADNEDKAISQAISQCENRISFYKNDMYFQIYKSGLIGFRVTPYLSEEERKQKAKNKLLGK